MGKSVDAIKTSEDEWFAYYDYQYKVLVDNKPGTLETVVGKLKVGKINGEVHYLELAPGDNGSMA